MPSSSRGKKLCSICPDERLLDRYRLGKIALLIDVATAPYGDVIRQQLQRDYIEDRQQQLRRTRDKENVIHKLSDVVVAARGNGNHFAGPRRHLLDVRQRFLVAQYGVAIRFVLCREHHHRQRLVDEGVWSVLHFARRIPFGVNIGNFLQLQRAFERNRVVNASSKEKEVARVGIQARQRLALIVAGAKDLLD